MIRPAPNRQTLRPGFTLVELLTVIAIIAVLIGLTTAAVQKVRHRSLELRTHNDIRQLSAAVDVAKSKYGVDWIPSRLMLRNDGNYNIANQIEMDSATFVKKVWPRIQYPVFNAASRGWFPDDPGANVQSAYLLEGHQCLVFFLGGIQYTDPGTGLVTCRGFSVNY